MGVQTFPSEIHADSLLLRRYALVDAAGLWRMVNCNRDRLMRNFAPLAKGFEVAEAAVEFIFGRELAWDAGQSFTYGLWRGATDDDPVGQITIKNIDWRVPSAELSYFVSRTCLRRGVASEAVRAILREAFVGQGFRRMYARVIASNLESLALVRKLEFRHEGIHRNDFRCGYGELHDVHYFGMTGEEHGGILETSRVHGR
jgi:RimJ/RimL family protein N-acetyltransferase